MTDTAASLAARLIRNFNDADQQREVREPLYDSTGARLAPGTAARGLGVSVTTIAPGKRSCPYHYHYAEEEVFVVIDGTGSLRVAGEMLPLRAGDVVFIPPGPQYPHQIINTSAQPLKYLGISTREAIEIVEYPDSGKFLAEAAPTEGRKFDLLQRAGANLDYWDGEP
jgi:uncharacterized cupin superfamily protein